MNAFAALRTSLFTRARAHPRQAVAVCLLAGASAAALAGLGYFAVSGPGRAPDGVSAVPVPLEPPPLVFRDLPPERAEQANLAIPFSTERNFAAKPFVAAADDATDARALECLATAVYFEAASEPVEGQRAVAQVVLNRVRHPAFPASVCEVVYQGSTRATGCQFSFTCDGSLRRRPVPALWNQAWRVAQAALAGQVDPKVGLATHYHANYVLPYWATSLEKNAQVGLHIFYRWGNGWGRPAAFTQRYAKREPDPRILSQTAILAHRDLTPEPVVPPELPVEVSTDPRLELAGVIQRLAARPSNAQPPGAQASAAQTNGAGDKGLYDDNIQAFFGGSANHPATLLFRSLPQQHKGFTTPLIAELMLHLSPPPQLKPRGRIPARLTAAVGGPDALDALLTSMRSFAVETNFRRFYADHRPFYASLTKEADKGAAAALTRLEAYTGVSLGERKLLVSPLLQGADCKCRAPAVGDTWVLLGGSDAATGGSAAYEFAHRILDSIAQGDGPRPWRNAAQKEEIVQALLDRTGNGPAASAEAGSQNRPMLTRLKVYEAQRAKFPTFADFVPTLLGKA